MSDPSPIPWFDVALILDSALDEDAETRDLLRGKLRGRNRVMDALIGSLDGALALPLADAQAIYRAFGATGVYGELVVNSGWPDSAKVGTSGSSGVRSLAATATALRRPPRICPSAAM